MPEEHTYNQVPGSAPEPEQNAAPTAPNQGHSSVYPHASGVEQQRPAAHHKPGAFSDFPEGNSKSIFPSVLVWLVFVIVLILSGYFWLVDYGNVKSISEKENEKNQITTQLNSTNNKEAKEQAESFNFAFTMLNNLISSSTPKSALLTELYTHFTRDVKISTLSMSGEEGFAVDGATGSYRQVADFMLGLKGYNKISNISLKSVSLSTEEGVPANQKITFSISADMQMTKEVAKTETTGDSATSQSSSSTSATNSTPAATPPTSTSTNQ